MTKLAVITDLRFGRVALSDPRDEIADILLLRAVHRLNRVVKPDATVLLGNLLNDGTAPDAVERMGHLQKIVEKLESPAIVIPGNFDGDVETFYRCFTRPSEICELGGARLLPFLGKPGQDFSASSARHDQDRFRAARDGFSGPIVALQLSDRSIFEVAAAMSEANVCLALSGHSGESRHSSNDTTRFIAAPAMCDAPFPFLIVTIDSNGVSVEESHLAMPRDLRLFDWHVHSQFAYCSENMEFDRAKRVGRAVGLAGLSFAEHSGHLYFDGQEYWYGGCWRDGMESRRPEADRTDAYFQEAMKHKDPSVRIGLEVDCDYRGNLILTPRDRERAEVLIGSIHALPTPPDEPGFEKRSDEFLFLVESMLKQGIRIVAHPFRVFRGPDRERLSVLFEPVVKLLREYGAAAELNFHINTPPEPFFERCIESGVKLTFGSDAHSLYEVGDFAMHLDLLNRIGYDGHPADILLNPADLA